MYQDFIKDLCRQKNRMMYAKVTALTWDELPIEFIEGSLTGGNISLDGASALRRTCSLTMVTQERNLANHQWSLNTKFKLEIGIQNLINNQYDDVIWFNQGIYVITSFSQTLNATSNTINISGKDKMCLLNGDVGGNLEAQVDFGKMEQVDKDGNITLISYNIKDIIRQAVHQYGKEPFHNIIINDLDEKGLELREYRGDVPLYMYRQQGAKQIKYLNIINEDTLVRPDGAGTDIPIGSLPCYDQLSKISTENEDITSGTPFRVAGDDTSESLYCATKITYGQAVGYTETELTYAGELIANIGESLTSVLDKIVKMLGQFEYFYDVSGQFIFQRKKDVIQFGETLLDKPLLTSQSYIDFTFESNDLITAISNNVNLLNIKNDFSVWGTRKGAVTNIPIHMRYAIDIKPTKYTSIAVDFGTEEHKGSDWNVINDYNKKYNVTLQGQTSTTYKTVQENNNDIICDWREIIYQMASDYYKYNFLDDFALRIAKANPNLYPSGVTGYEQYYIDIQGFWRELYRPNIANEVVKYNNLKQLIDNYNLLLSDSKPTSEQIAKLQMQKAELEKDNKYNTDEFFYEELLTSYIDLINKTTALQESEKVIIQDKKDKANTIYNKRPFNLDDFYADVSHSHYGWNKNIYENPSNLSFWFDFLESNGELSKISVRQIGSRTKIVNDSAVQAISYTQTPDIKFYLMGEANKPTDKESYIRITPEWAHLFTISTQGKSAEEAVATLLQNHAYAIESTTITAIPIYSLQPNTRIQINDKDNSGLVGEYTLSKITLPLTYNGTMSLTATKVIHDTL